MITIVVTVMENTSCKVTECYLYRGPDNKVTRNKAEVGFIKQIEEIQGKLNDEQRQYYLEKAYYPGAYHTVCLVDSPEVHVETAEEKKARVAKEKKAKKK